ncbi:hypothetical protein [Stomatobaculum longum]|uniref:hypothetical protein n=1 Tax=Stomatobaculum longum TaxID=796942 RepID=UPI0028801667|nr:hypothetical protein [Stomatobaculum longum]
MKRRMVLQETKHRERKSAKEREAKERGNEPEEIERKKRKTVGSELRRKNEVFAAQKNSAEYRQSFNSWDRGGSNS